MILALHIVPRNAEISLSFCKMSVPCTLVAHTGPVQTQSLSLTSKRVPACSATTRAIGGVHLIAREVRLIYVRPHPIPVSLALGDRLAVRASRGRGRGRDRHACMHAPHLLSP
jgi:hypothetical protein